MAKFRTNLTKARLERWLRIHKYIFTLCRHLPRLVFDSNFPFKIFFSVYMLLLFQKFIIQCHLLLELILSILEKFLMLFAQILTLNFLIFLKLSERIFLTLVFGLKLGSVGNGVFKLGFEILYFGIKGLYLLWITTLSSLKLGYPLLIVSLIFKGIFRRFFLLTFS